MCDTPNNPTDNEYPTVEPERRGVLRSWMAAFVVGMLLPWIANAKKIGLRLSKFKSLEKVGGAARLKVKGYPLVIIRDSETTVRVFNPTCTHKKCKVKYAAEDKQFNCKCHKSAFNFDGVPINGPAPKPLTRYDAKISKGRVIITLPDAVAK